MTPFSVHALMAAAAMAAFCLWRIQASSTTAPGTWRWTALVALAFAAYSGMTVLNEGPTGFWSVHTQTLWGLQVWMDLLLMACVGWAALLPRTRAVGMHPLLWLAALLVGGSIGLLAMLARLQYLQERATR